MSGLRLEAQGSRPQHRSAWTRCCSCVPWLSIRECKLTLGLSSPVTLVSRHPPVPQGPHQGNGWNRIYFTSCLKGEIRFYYTDGVCMCTCAFTCAGGVDGGQSFRSGFWPPTMCVPGMKLRSLGLVANAFTLGVILPSKLNSLKSLDQCPCSRPT